MVLVCLGIDAAEIWKHRFDGLMVKHCAELQYLRSSMAINLKPFFKFITKTFSRESKLEEDEN